jgi:hypothetical protein
MYTTISTDTDKQAITVVEIKAYTKKQRTDNYSQIQYDGVSSVTGEQSKMRTIIFRLGVFHWYRENQLSIKRKALLLTVSAEIQAISCLISDSFVGRQLCFQ